MQRDRRQVKKPVDTRALSADPHSVAAMTRPVAAQNRPFTLHSQAVHRPGRRKAYFSTVGRNKPENQPGASNCLL